MLTLERAALAVLFALCAPACGASSLDGGAGADGGLGRPECFSSNECPTGWTCSEFGTCVPPTNPGDAGPTQPPEVEYELGEAVSSMRFIYVAMTELDSLAKIDGQTLAVSSLAVGEAPREVVAAPGSDTAVVLDSVNGTATIVRPAIDADLKITVATLPHLNRLVIDPTGTYAVSWFDLNKAVSEAGSLGAVENVGSFQDVTIIDLSLGSEKAVDLTVGFRPRAVKFDQAGTRAYVITEDGISVIDLAQATQSLPTIVPPIPVSGNPFTEPETLEVDIVATGSYAVVREAGQSMIRILSLTGSDAGQSWQIALPGEPSDVDLSPDGTRAYAVIRDTSQLAVLDVPGDGLDPGGVELVDLGGELVGSLVLSADGKTGLLFTNAFSSERLTVIHLDQTGYPHVTHPLEKSVRLAQLSPAGDKAMIVHAKDPGDPDSATTFDEYIDRSYGYSIFDIAQGFAKLQITPVDPGGFAFAPNVPKAYLILDGGDAEGAVARLHTIELATGVVREADLGSPPEAVGILPSVDVAFVSQRHPLGRVSFVNITTDERRTVTGFDLNSRIID